MPAARPTVTTLLATATATLAALATAGSAPAPAVAATITTLDGPGPDVKLTGGVDLAADGTGGLVYVKAVGGTDHVFLSRRTATGWSAPEQVSSGSGGAAQTREPKVAAFPGGGLIVAWRAGAGSTLLKAAVSPGTGQPFVVGNVVDLNVVTAYDLDAAPDGSAYVSFTEAANVRAAHLPTPTGTWSLLGGGATAIDPAGILDRTPSEEAALPGGMSESDIAVHAGGAVMTWTESEGVGVTDVLTRRLTGTTVGAPVELTVDTLDGRPRAGMGDMTDIAMADDGTAHVAFRQVFTYGATERPRDLVRSLPLAGAPTAPQVVDGLPADPPEGAEFPGIAVSRDGAHGLVGMPRQLTFQTFASRLTAGTWSAGARADTGTPTGASTPVAAVGDTGFGVVAWQGTPAVGDTTVEASSGGGTLGPPETLSVAGAGPVVFNDTESITAGAERDGTTHLLFAQGAAATRRVVVATVPTTVPLTPPAGGTPTPGAPVPPPAPAPGSGTSIPPRQTFGRTPLVRLPATVRRRSGRLSITLRNAEPFTVRATVEVRTRSVRGRRGVRLLAPVTVTLKAGQTRSIRPRVRGVRAGRALRRGARVTVRATVRAPLGASRTLARTARVRTG